MRILFLTQWFQPEPNFKGLPFARALSARGHEVQVLTGFPNYPGGELYSGYRIRAWQKEIMDGIPVTRVPLYPSHDTSGQHRILNYLSFAASAMVPGTALVRKPDVIYVYNLITLYPAARFIRRLYGCPIVFDVQDLWPESVAASAMMGQGRALRLLKSWSDKVYRSVDRLAVLSPGMKDALIQRGVWERDVDVIYNWADEESLSSEMSEVPENLGLCGRFNVLFAGTMGKAQALDEVLNAAGILKDRLPVVQFILVGGGVEVPHLKRRAEAMGLSNVRFLDRLPPDRISGLLHAADALLVHLQDSPLFRITIPSKTQAYLATGRPVLMGVRGDAADLITRSGAGYTFQPENGPALELAVEHLAALPSEERIQMGERGQAFYQNELSMNAGVSRFEALFVEVVSRKKSRLYTRGGVPTSPVDRTDIEDNQEQ